MYKKFLLLNCLFLFGCISLPAEDIQTDAENINTLSSIQQEYKTDIEENKSKNANFTKCMQQINELKKINSKDKITSADINNLKKIFDENYIHEINCYEELESHNSVYDYKQQFKDYCYQKYWEGTWTTAIILFPVRMLNELLMIGTGGLFPIITGSCSAGESNFSEIFRKEGFFTTYCWKPGATWNYETCKKLSENISLDAISPANSVFTEQETQTLKNKINKYCENNYFKPKQRLDSKQCKRNLEKGCLQDFSGYSVSIFGTRDEGIIVDAFLDLQSYFIYDKSDYFDGQKVKNTEYYYEYVGIYNDTLQKLPAFKRSNTKKIQFNGHCEALNR